MVGEKPKRKMGRPTKMTPAVQNLILTRLANGESLTKICRSSDRVPSVPNVFAFIAKDADFRNRYALARDVQADVMAEETLDISDDASNDFITKVDKDGNEYEVVDHEHIQRSKLRVDARKWLASKLKPKKYGDRTTIAGDPEAPLATHAMSEDKFMEIAKKAKDQV